MLIAKPVEASVSSPVDIGDKSSCEAYFSYYERVYGIPNKLLSSIAHRESGRFNKATGTMASWPWAMNAEMNGYYPKTKQDAIAKVRELNLRGIESIDVGCMQVNLRHHKNAFNNLNEAFDPKSNVEYAARFLRTLYDETRSWRHAVMYYHSRTPHLGIPYANNVIKTWRKKMGYSGSDSSYSSASAQADKYVKPKRIAIERKSQGQMVIKVTDTDNGSVKVLRMNPSASEAAAHPKDFADASNVSAASGKPRIINFDNNGRISSDTAQNQIQKRATPVDFIFD